MREPRRYFRFMGKYWSCPQSVYVTLCSGIDRDGYVPDVEHYPGVTALLSRPRNKRIEKIEPEQVRYG
jgi:hypothetical protein